MADLASARRRAEETLRRVLANAAAIVRLSWSDGATAADCRNLERIKTAAADIAQDHKALRGLLAALPEEGASAPTTLPPQSGALGYMAKYNAGCTDGLPSEHTQLAPDALTAYCDVCESDRRQPCHSTTTGEVALYPHPERVVAARVRAAKGGE